MTGTTPNGMEYILARDGIVDPQARQIIEALDAEFSELYSCVNSACSALTESIKAGDDDETLLDLVARLMACVPHEAGKALAADLPARKSA